MADDSVAACTCHETGPRFPHAIVFRDVGRDETKGRFADVDVIECGLCGLRWIKYLVEYEGFTGAGRWGQALIDENRVMSITAEEAPEFIEAAAWCLYGGSYYGHAGRRGAGRLLWDL